MVLILYKCLMKYISLRYYYIFVLIYLHRFVNNAFVGDEFIGRAFIPLSDLSQTGAEHNVTLTSHSENHSHGKLHLLLHRESVQRQLSDNNVS